MFQQNSADDRMETFCGTTGYASPEMLACRKYLGLETDIWSLGVILYTLLCGGLPFDDDDERVMKELIFKGEYEEPEWLSEGECTLHATAPPLKTRGAIANPGDVATGSSAATVHRGDSATSVVQDDHR